MGLINMTSKIPAFMMKLSSSIFASGSTGSFLAATLDNDSFLSVVFNIISKLFYFIAKWLLYFLDILYSFIQQLCGLNMSYESLEKMVSKESDFVFNMLITATETITPIIRALIGLVVALIILFAMIAVAKNMFNSLKKGGTADIKGVFKDTFKAFILLFITPMIAIAGIIASNTILKTLYNATNPTQSTSLSTQLFSASATAANSYRIYAQNGLKIPITIDLPKEEEIVEFIKNNSVDQEAIKYLQSEQNKLYTSFKMFREQDYKPFNELITYEIDGSVKYKTDSTYYDAYDRGPDAYDFLKGENPTLYMQYKTIDTYKPEYYVMADVVDFCIETGTPIYYKTIEEVLDSLSETTDNRLFNSFVDTFEIEFLDAELNRFELSTATVINTGEVRSSYSTYKDIFNNEAWQVIQYTSKYYDTNENSEPTRVMKINYHHLNGAVDELEGAEYIVAVEQQTEVGGVTHPYYYPLTTGFGVGSEYGFETEFIQNGQIVSAKGIFSDATYPTAIRKNADGTEVEFYRQEVIQVNLGKINEVANGSLAVEEQKPNGIVAFFQSLIQMFVPKITLGVNTDKVVVAYETNEVIVNTLPVGKMSLSYMFSDAFTSGLGGLATSIAKSGSGEDGTEQIGVFGLNLSNLFVARKLNILVLVVGAYMLIKITFTAVFALINRAYELFLIILIYPTACATLPLEDSAYRQWTTSYIQRLFSTYGLILGLNFVIMLFPIISEIEFFTAGEIALSKPIMRFRNLFNSTVKVVTFGGVQSAVSVDFLADFLNLVVVILFELTAFTLLETIPETIQKITGVSGAQGGINPIEAIGKVLKTASGVIKTVFSGGSAIIAGVFDILGAIAPSKKMRDAARQRIKQKVKNKTDKLLEGVKSFVPGSEIYRGAKDRSNTKKRLAEQKEAFAALKESMDDKDNDPQKVQDNFSKLLDAQKKATKAISDPRGERKAEDERIKENAAQGLDENGEAMSRNEGDVVEEGDEGGLSFKSDRELRRQRRKTKKIIAELERRAESGGLTAAQQEALETQKKLLEDIENGQKKRREYSTSVSDAKKTVARLTRLQGQGALTQEQEDQLAAAQIILEGHAQHVADEKQKRRSSEQATKKKKRDDAREKREREQSEAERKKMERAFKGNDKASLRLQRKYLTDMAKEQEGYQAQLNATGLIGVNLAEMTVEQMQEKLKDDTLTEQQKQIIESYMGVEKTKQEMMGYSSGEYAEARAEREARLAAYKKGGSNMFGGLKHGRDVQRGIREAAGADQELKDVERQLAEFGQVTAANVAQYQALKRKQNELKRKLAVADKFSEISGMSRAERRAQRREAAVRDKWHREAMEELRDTGESMTRANLDRIMERKRQEYYAKHKRKKK